MKFQRLSSLSVIACAACRLAAAADLGDRMELHGYGNQDYLRASANEYLGADTHGSWDNNLLALVGIVTLTDRSRLWVQLESEAPDPVRLDWFFVDYRISDRLRAQVGRAKLPFGIYNEIADVHYLQVSAVPPLLYQDAGDITHETYQGLGIDYESVPAKIGSWRAQVWLGNTVSAETDDDLTDRRALGGKLTWSTPLKGLKLMFSGFRTEVEIPGDGSFRNEDRAAVSLDYVDGGVDIKSEYASHELGETKRAAWYVQGGYSIADKWIPYVRYDHAIADRRLDNEPSFYQETWVLGIGYRIGSSFGLRLENHFNRGYALPVASGEVVAGEGRRNWCLLAASVNFIF